MESKFKCEYQIQYRDVDSNQNLKFSSLLYLFQEASMVHGEAVGRGLDDLYKMNLTWVTLGWNIKVVKMPKYMEKVNVYTWTNLPAGASVIRQFEMKDIEGNTLAYAEDKFVLFDISKRKLVRISNEIVQSYNPNDERTTMEEFPKLKELSEYEISKEMEVHLPDVDTNRHVNNIKYVEYILEFIPIEEQEKIVSMKINYKKEIMYPTIFNVYCCKINNKYVFKIENSNTNELNCLIEAEI